MQRDNNIFEHDYIIEALEMFASDLQAAKLLSSIIDKHACIITAFMQGQVLSAEKQTAHKIIYICDDLIGSGHDDVGILEYTKTKIRETFKLEI